MKSRLARTWGLRHIDEVAIRAARGQEHFGVVAIREGIANEGGELFAMECFSASACRFNASTMPYASLTFTILRLERRL
jgi:hypothetical protein